IIPLNDNGAALRTARIGTGHHSAQAEWQVERSARGGPVAGPLRIQRDAIGRHTRFEATYPPRPSLRNGGRQRAGPEAGDCLLAGLDWCLPALVQEVDIEGSLDADELVSANSEQAGRN